MMYLSKLTLNPRSRQVQAELRSVYEMHRTLTRAFGDDKAEYEAARCLFRVENTEESRFPIVLFQSLVCPDWEPLIAKSDYFVSEPLVKPFTPVFTAGQRLTFRLRANPTVCHNGKRTAIWEKKPVGESPLQRVERLERIERQRQEWMYRKAENAGFRIESLLMLPEGEMRFLASARANGYIEHYLFRWRSASRQYR